MKRCRFLTKRLCPLPIPTVAPEIGTALRANFREQRVSSMSCSSMAGSPTNLSNSRQPRPIYRCQLYTRQNDNWSSNQGGEVSPGIGLGNQLNQSLL